MRHFERAPRLDAGAPPPRLKSQLAAHRLIVATGGAAAILIVAAAVTLIAVRGGDENASVGDTAGSVRASLAPWPPE